MSNPQPGEWWIYKGRERKGSLPFRLVEQVNGGLSWRAHYEYYPRKTFTIGAAFVAERCEPYTRVDCAECDREAKEGDYLCFLCRYRLDHPERAERQEY